MWTPNMTLAESRESMRSMLLLQLRHAARMAATRGTPLVRVIDELTELRRYCVNPNPESDSAFSNLLIQLEALHQRGGEEGLVAEAWSLIRPLLEPRLKSEWAKSRDWFAASYDGFAYEFHPEYFGPPEPDLLTLHFRNAFGPASPFEHPRRLADALIRLLDDAQAARPQVDQVQCATWLNHIPLFTSLFPSEWMRRSSGCPFEPNTGWWGQYIDRTGQVDPHKARVLLVTGAMKYGNLHCRCGRDDLRKHLRGLVAVASYDSEHHVLSS